MKLSDVRLVSWKVTMWAWPWVYVDLELTGGYVEERRLHLKNSHDPRELRLAVCKEVLKIRKEMKELGGGE